MYTSLSKEDFIRQGGSLWYILSKNHNVFVKSIFIDRVFFHYRS